MVQSCAIFGLDPCVPIERDGASVLHNWSRASGPFLSKRNPFSMNPNYSAAKPRCWVETMWRFADCENHIFALKQNTQVDKAKKASFLNAQTSPLENC